MLSLLNLYIHTLSSQASKGYTLCYVYTHFFYFSTSYFVTFVYKERNWSYKKYLPSSFNALMMFPGLRSLWTMRCSRKCFIPATKLKMQDSFMSHLSNDPWLHSFEDIVYFSLPSPFVFLSITGSLLISPPPLRTSFYENSSQIT